MGFVKCLGFDRHGYLFMIYTPPPPPLPTDIEISGVGLAAAGAHTL